MEKTGKFEEIKPMNGVKLAEYLETIKQMRIPENYYVPYNVKYSDSIKINYYPENKMNYLVVEYEVPQEENSEETQHVKLIMAKHQNTIGDLEKIQTTLKMFFKSSKMYSTSEAVSPATYIATLQKMGWEFTSEGVEFMQVTKAQGDVEIKRTQFTEAELEELSTGEQKEKNKKQHIDRSEKDIIESIKRYVVDTYEKMPTGLSDELDTYKEKVQAYSKSQKTNKGNSNLLDAVFRELKPIKETSSIIPLIQRSYNQNLEGYLDMIPQVFRDKQSHNNYKKYMQIREVATKEKEENNKELPENSLAETKLEELVKKMDKERDEKINSEMEKISPKETNKEDGIEIA